MAGSTEARDPVAAGYEEGLGLIARGEYFAAHEALEDAWRAAAPEERDFFQGLVHVAVAWYQAGRGNRVGCERQLAKAERRLAPFAPSHRGLDVSGVLEQVRVARAAYPDLPRPRLPAARGLVKS
jgi:predicted metal-dependent hydrolase